MILSDGWDRGAPDALAEQMQRLARVAHAIVWVNPLKASPGYAPLAQGMAAALPYVDEFVEGHSLAALESLVAVLAEPRAPERFRARASRRRSAMKEVLADIERWRADGRRVAVAACCGHRGIESRDAGATMVVSDQGEVAGSVSGGCVEGAVVTTALEVLNGERERGIVTFGYSDDEAFAVGLTCGGTIHVFVEPLDW